MFRKAVVGAVAGSVALAVALAGCGDEKGPTLKVTEITKAGAVYQNPLDAVPGNSGSIYFTADGPSGPGVFVVSLDHGEPRALAVGKPFGRPVGIAVTADDRSVLVADAQADAVLAVPVTGGTPVPLPGSTGLAPRGLEVKGDQLYVTGVDPAGRPAVLAMPTAGGQPRVATPLASASNLSLGNPAGLAVNRAGTGLMVSSLSASGTAQVVTVDVASGQTSVFDDVIGANHGAGGLHEAADGRSYAWADVSRSGRVYRIEP